jgi:hypothetical protein
LLLVTEIRVARFFLVQHTKNVPIHHKIIQLVMEFIKWP